jgi:hypothetical protein
MSSITGLASTSSTNPRSHSQRGSPFGPHPKSDLATDLYSGSTLIAIMNESDHRIRFNLLNKSTISLPAVIEASDSPLGPRPERDLATNLHSGLSAIKAWSWCRGTASGRSRCEVPDQIGSNDWLLVQAIRERWCSVIRAQR